MADIRQPGTAEIEDAVRHVVEMAGPRASGILLRRPAVDPRFPNTSDLDFLVLADIGDMRAERLPVPHLPDLMVDLTWIPWVWVKDPALAAARGWLPHRMLSSDPVWDATGTLPQHLQEVRTQMYVPEVQRQRLAVFFDTGFQTVREIGITWDFPALALFWLHMGHAASLAVLSDGTGKLCPNVYTRPFDYLDGGLRPRWIKALHLDADPAPLSAALRRMHAALAPRFPEPLWPPGLNEGSRADYRYWLSAREVDWRIAVAAEMAERGDVPSAVYYLRFCAYAIARLPMVHACALEGRNVSYLRPERRVLPSLERLAPEILPDLQFVLGGAIDVSQVQTSLELLLQFRDESIACLRAHGSPVPELRPWDPYQPQAA